ncbi:MAG: FkbM family methyltransferase [Pseudomonadota bacterium]
MNRSVDPPFGTYRLTPRQKWFREIAAQLPYTYAGRKMASLLLGPAGGRAQQPYDVEIFEGARARLYPFDNIAEKRVFLTPTHWDPEERKILSMEIQGKSSTPFQFVDVGANAGLYTLFCLAEARRAGKQLKSLGIEPDPEMARRLRTNVFVSSASDDVTVLEIAASDHEGTASFEPNRNNRGMNRIDPDGSSEVKTSPLSAILKRQKIEAIDAMKVDIEGHEITALRPFLEIAAAEMLPTLLMVEISHLAEREELETLAAKRGYSVLFQNNLNQIFKLVR